MNTLDRYNDKVFAWQYEYGEQGSNHGDIEYYKKKLKKIQGKVLELGCGTGRLTIPLKKAGINIVGLDQAKAMVQIARKKAAKKNLKISFIVNDAITFDSHSKFDTIIFPYNSLTQIAEKDIPKLIINIKNHLKPDSKFIFDIGRPIPGKHKFPRVKRINWSDPLYINELGVTVRRESTWTRRPEKNLIEISYHWEISHKGGRTEHRKTAMQFSTRQDDWYIEQFEKKGFKLIEYKIEIDKAHKVPKKYSFVELQLTQQKTP
jgi:SAM-dependent methyltransferase